MLSIKKSRELLKNYDSSDEKIKEMIDNLDILIGVAIDCHVNDRLSKNE